MPSFTVVARFRPIDKRETKIDSWVPYMIQDPNFDLEFKSGFEYEGYSGDKLLTTLMVMSEGDVRKNPTFTFDRVFWCDTKQELVFDALGKPAVDDFFKGMDVSFFAYGQSGSGKTFTLFGPKVSVGQPRTELNKIMGIFPRSISLIYDKINNSTGIAEFIAILQVFEIDMDDQIRDLLHPAGPRGMKLRVRESGKGIFIQGLKGAFVRTMDEVHEAIEFVFSNRSRSGVRSHLIVEFRLRAKTSEGYSSTKMNFVELCGSESGLTASEPIHQKEARAVYRSLNVLGRCITALVNGAKNPPFRENTLTRCLQNSLEGNSKTTLIILASPCQGDIAETIRSFRFVSRAQLIKSKAKNNITRSERIEMRRQVKPILQNGENNELKVKGQGADNATTISEIYADLDGAISEDEKEQKSAVKLDNEHPKMEFQEKEMFQQNGVNNELKATDNLDHDILDDLDSAFSKNGENNELVKVPGLDKRVTISEISNPKIKDDLDSAISGEEKEQKWAVKRENEQPKIKSLEGGQKGASVPSSEIKVIWDGPFPGVEKERKIAAKELYNKCKVTLESLGNVDTNFNGEYTAVLMILPINQHDTKRSEKAEKLNEDLRTEATDPISNHKSNNKANQLSVDALVGTNAQLKASTDLLSRMNEGLLKQLRLLEEEKKTSTELLMRQNEELLRRLRLFEEEKKSRPEAGENASTLQVKDSAEWEGSFSWAKAVTIVAVVGLGCYTLNKAFNRDSDVSFFHFRTNLWKKNSFWNMFNFDEVASKKT